MKPRYVFIAIGIGITPFRSIIKNLLDTKRRETITLFCLANDEEFLFHDVFSEAEKQLGLTTIYLAKKTIIDEHLLKKHIADPQVATFYLSGPQEIVEEQREILMSMSISNNQIKTDLFTGYGQLE